MKYREIIANDTASGLEDEGLQLFRVNHHRSQICFIFSNQSL